MVLCLSSSSSTVGAMLPPHARAGQQDYILHRTINRGGRGGRRWGVDVVSWDIEEIVHFVTCISWEVLDCRSMKQAFGGAPITWGFRLGECERSTSLKRSAGRDRLEGLRSGGMHSG